MKTNHLTTIIAALAITLFSFGCKQYDHPIAGKSYCYKTTTMYSEMEDIYSFSKNGKCEWIVNTKTPYEETDKYSETHFKWEVNGDEITVLYDNSTHWKKEVRGTTCVVFTYDKDRDILINGDQEYTRWP